jgi:tetratricopeptide (TPR) repeat protein
MLSDDEYTGPAKETLKEIEKMFNKLGKYTWEDIRSKCEYAIGLDPSCYPTYVYLGIYEQDRKNYDKMEEYFFKALEVAENPHNAYTWDSVIMTLDDAMRDYERLVKYLQKFYDKQPNYFVIDYLTKTLWKKLNRKGEALSVLNKYLLDHPNDKKAVKLRKKMMKARS